MRRTEILSYPRLKLIFSVCILSLKRHVAYPSLQRGRWDRRNAVEDYKFMPAENDFFTLQFQFLQALQSLIFYRVL